jgi:hypothetical protein
MPGMGIRLCLVAVLVALLPGFAPPAWANVLIEIDKSTQHMTVSVDGAPLYDWPVSTGMRGRETPAGSFKPFRMEAEHYSKEWDDAPMPHSIFFTQVGHAIHGSAHRLGRPASHGCVRISTADAATLYALVQEQGLPNTRVVITGTEPLPAEPRVAGSGRDVDPDFTNRARAEREARRRQWLGEDDQDLYGRYADGDGALYDAPYPETRPRRAFRPYPDEGYFRPYGIYPEDPYLNRGWE